MKHEHTLSNNTIQKEGIAEKTNNHLQPSVGITSEAITISNIVPLAQLIWKQNMFV